MIIKLLNQKCPACGLREINFSHKSHARKGTPIQCSNCNKRFFVSFNSDYISIVIASLAVPLFVFGLISPLGILGALILGVLMPCVFYALI